MNAIPHSDTVLVVDDSPETLAMINDTLENAGLTCLVAIDPQQGLHIAHRMQPDLILLDGLMPNMSGFEFCRYCKQDPDLRDIPIVFMTGLSDSDNIVKAFAAGGADYVTKPIDTQALVARLRVHLATAKIIRSTQLALDKAGQHVFAVNPAGQFLWQTPDVHVSLSKAANQVGSDWLNKEFWPAIERWIVHSDLSHQPTLNLKAGDIAVILELLTPQQATSATSGEILIRLQTSNEKDALGTLREHFQLSAREAEVLFWISKGKTNREMGFILDISPRTINKHLEQVFKKLSVDNRTNAAAKAIPLLRHGE